MIQKGIIKKENNKYPELLKKIPDAPKKLFWKGNYHENIFHNTLAVVGSRKMTSYGKQVAQELIGEIAGQGIIIVSGFMYGIDATAHRAALAYGGKTIAVMPCGVETIHPSYQKNLFLKIIQNGLALSEYEEGSPSEKWIYPRRNRIIVGLSKAVLVIEAADKSGSLITADMSIKYKRKLFAIPGSIFSPVSKGTNNLIKNKLATPVLSAYDILEFFGKTERKRNQAKILTLTKEEKEIYEILKADYLELEKILEKTNLPIHRVGTILSLLEVKGMIKKEGPKYSIINSNNF